MGKLFDRLLGVIGVETEEEGILDETDSQWLESERPRKQKKNNLLGLPSQRPVTMMLLKAESYDDVEQIARHLKERRSVIVCLEEVEKDVAQRIVDFLSGAVFALDGSVQKVSHNTFLCAASNIDVVGQISDEERNRAFFNHLSWIKK